MNNKNMNSRKWHDNVFFGLHFDLHAGENDYELGSGLTVEHLVEELSKVRPDFVQCDCKGHPGYASYPTTVGVASPGVVKDSLRIWRDATRKLGIPLVMHFSGIWDTVAVKNHPEWARRNSPADGNSSIHPDEIDDKIIDKNMVCPLSDYTLDYMAQQMIEIIDKYDVDGFWVDGENWAATPCYCEVCKTLFSNRTGKTAIPKGKGEEGWEEWIEFQRQNFEEHVRRYTAEVHRRKPECTICSNWMYTVRQPDVISVPVDYLSGDFDWIWSVERAIAEARMMDGRNMSWDLMAWGFTSYGPMKSWTFKTASALCQEAAVVMSCSGAFMIYDTPNRTGDLVGWHMDLMAEVARFCRARQEYCQNTKSVPQVVILHDKNHFYDNSTPLYNFGGAQKQVEGALHAILDNNYHTDILCDSDLFKNIDSYKLCVVAEQNNLSKEKIEKLKDYVKNGGNLIVSGAEHTKKFDDIAGVKDLGTVVGEDKGQSLYIRDGKTLFTALGYWRLVKIDDAIEVEPLMFSRNLGERQKNSGSPAAIIKEYGKGKIALIFGPVFGTYFDSHYPGARRFIREIIDKLGINGLAKVEAPVCVNITIREKENRIMINFVNLGTGKALSPRNTIIEDVPPVGPTKVSIPLYKEPSAVFLAPSGMPVEWEYEGNTGLLKAKIDLIGIHDILVVEK